MTLAQALGSFSCHQHRERLGTHWGHPDCGPSSLSGLGCDQEGNPRGTLLFPLMGPCPQKACQDEDRVEAGSLIPEEGNTHFRSGMGCIVSGRITRRATSEDSRGCRGTERGDPGCESSRGRLFLCAATFPQYKHFLNKAVAFRLHELMLRALGGRWPKQGAVCSPPAEEGPHSKTVSPLA